MDHLAQVFNRFATFGAGKGKYASESGSPPLMDSRSLQKLCRDCRLFSPPLLTSTEVDLIFKKVKPRNELKIDFIEFVECTRQMAEKLGVPQEDLIEKILESDGPTLNTVLSPATSHHQNQMNSSHSSDKMYRSMKSDIDTSAMTSTSSSSSSSDASQQSPYTESKNPPPPYSQATEDSQSIPVSNSVVLSVNDLHPNWYEVKNPNATSEYDQVYYANRITHETRWEKPLPPPPPPFNPKLLQTPSRRFQSHVPATTTQANNIPKSQDPRYGYSYQSPPMSTDSSRKTMSEQPHRSIFDKLTDTSLYTGSHKYRFDETGRGLGLTGRDSVKKGAGFATAGATNVPTAYKGNTNTGTDEVFHDISEFTQRR